ncbi:sigma-70 family RNA polymerase sigma factor [Lysinibacillus telephonicus]|uniref:sigma-70 family RNA polymerase sigma factor n=1 Tax=Lysinibacillus telephonicus TaxID=1714840 RepID=UPI0031FDCE58
MQTFDEVFEKYSPMISHVLKRTNIYKNHDYYRQSAAIALWKAWQNYDETLGDFAPYAYRTMLTTIYTEMRKDNQYNGRNIAYDKEELVNIAQYYEMKNRSNFDFGQLEDILSQLKLEEYNLLMNLYVYQYSYKELAKIENIPLSTLKKRRDRLIKKIREMIVHRTS